MQANNFAIGLSRPFNLLDTIADGVRALGEPKVIAPFPPYDIIRYSENEFAIQVALAGFSLADISIQGQDRHLVISGEKPTVEAKGEFVHRGIAARAFERRFLLSEYVEVGAATYKDGLLKVELVRRVPEEKKVRKIEIVNLDAPATAQAAE